MRDQEEQNHGAATPRHHHERRHRTHGHEPAPDPLDLRDPRPGRRGAEERRPGDARPDPGRPQRRARAEARQGAWRLALDHRPRRGAEGQEGHAVLRRRDHAASRRAAQEGDEGRQAHLLREAGVGDAEGRARSGARRQEGRHQARRGAGQAVPAGPAQAQASDRLRLLRPHPRRCAASSATGCSRATGSRRSGRPGTTRRPRAAASSSTWSATGATCSTTCSAMSRASPASARRISRSGWTRTARPTPTTSTTRPTRRSSSRAAPSRTSTCPGARACGATTS